MLMTVATPSMQHCTTIKVRFPPRHRAGHLAGTAYHGSNAIIAGRPSSFLRKANPANQRHRPALRRIARDRELFKMMAGVDMVHAPYRSNYPDLRLGR
jgi:hypothetical protein